MFPAIVFDDNLGRTAPLCDLRASFDLRTGGLTTLDRLRAALELRVVALRVPVELAALTAERHSIPVNRLPAGANENTYLLLNGRCAIPYDDISELSLGEGLVESSTGDLIAALVPAAAIPEFMADQRIELSASKQVLGPALISRPWHARHFRDAALAADLDLLTVSNSEFLREAPKNCTSFGHAPLLIEPDARIYPNVTFDLEHGPIYIGESSVVRPGATLIGPVWLGPHSTILDHAVIRGNTAIGPWCKVNGEVAGCIFQGYSNKAHDGYLGDAFIGEWVNLGASTVASNLLNTYGQISCVPAPGLDPEPTNQQFLGPMIGDHTKTAIATRLMTGSVIHTGCMLAQSTPLSGAVGPFTWSTDAGRSLFRFDKFADIARAAMARRKVEASIAYIARLNQLHAAAAKGGTA